MWFWPICLIFPISSVDRSGGQVRFLRDRVVWCLVGCLGDGLDRDVNAAVNLAGRVPAD